MRCIACSADNKDTARFCCKCGAPLSAPATSLGVAAPPGAKACAACSCSCRPDAKFCPRCGYRFADASSVVVVEAVPVTLSPSEQPADIVQSDANTQLPVDAQDEAAEPEVVIPPSTPPVESTKPLPAALAEDSPLPLAAERRSNPVAISAAMLVAILIAGGGGYWYFSHRSTTQTALDTRPSAGSGDSRVAATSSAAMPGPAAETASQQSSTPANAIGAEQNAATEAASPAVAAVDAQNQSRQGSTKAVEKRAARGPTKRPQVGRDDHAMQPSAPVISSAQGTSQGQVKKTCKGTSGIYRLTCEIEGAERYFRCAPDGKTWSHDLPECDRRSTDTK